LSDELVYMLLSWDIDDVFRVHGIFTDSYMKDNSKEITSRRDNLRSKYSSFEFYLVPLNHFVDKGMIL
jgi:hypothetical protein